MRSEKPRKVVHSSMLEQYEVKKDIVAKLDRAMEMRQYMLLGGRTPPNEIRLFRKDWVLIDDTVRRQSDGRFNGRSVTYKSLALIPHDEAAKPFALGEAA